MVNKINSCAKTTTFYKKIGYAKTTMLCITKIIQRSYEGAKIICIEVSFPFQTQSVDCLVEDHEIHIPGLNSNKKVERKILPAITCR